jgi:predicted nucleic acid-binding protein
MLLVDTNVVVDILTGDKTWLEWSAEQLITHGRSGPLYINEICYAELAVRIESESKLQSELKELSIELERTPTRALFVAGQAFRRYRAAGGPRTTILPDFFVGAHAEIAQRPLLTRDPRRFRAYFPKVKLITP